MAQLLMVTITLGCISLFYLLPGTLSGSLAKGLRFSRTRQVQGLLKQPPPEDLTFLELISQLPPIFSVA